MQDEIAQELRHSGGVGARTGVVLGWAGVYLAQELRESWGVESGQRKLSCGAGFGLVGTRATPSSLGPAPKHVVPDRIRPDRIRGYVGGRTRAICAPGEDDKRAAVGEASRCSDCDTGLDSHCWAGALGGLTPN